MGNLASPRLGNHGINNWSLGSQIDVELKKKKCKKERQKRQKKKKNQLVLFPI